MNAIAKNLSLGNLWANPYVRFGTYSLIGIVLLFTCLDVFADDKVGLVRYQTETLAPQAKSAWTIAKVVAIVLGLIFMIVGFVKLTRQQKEGAWMLIIVGGVLASVSFFVILAGESVSGQKLDKTTTDIIGTTTSG